ncbi:MAG: hypothetical protein K9L32_16350, partial [Chromatiaceae bacterium]|nr:hypothetical protein [Chromatiaceae bacterium]
MPERVIRPNPARLEPGLGVIASRVHSFTASKPLGAVIAEPLGALCSLAKRSHRPLPRLRWPVQAGFPSPAEDD